MNYLNGPGSAADISAMSPILKEVGWSNELCLSYGHADFNYGRFPEGEDPEKTKNMGFAFYDFE